MSHRQQDDPDKPLFVTEEIKAEMEAQGYAFDPPAYVAKERLRTYLAGVSDEDLAKWPAELLMEQERAKRRAKVAASGRPSSVNENEDAL